MLREEINNIKSDKGELRKFGITIGIVLGLFGLLLLWRGKDLSFYFLLISAGFVFFGVALPNILKPIHRIWMILAICIGWFMTRLILSVLFYVVFTMTRFLAALSGKRFLNLKMDKSKKSYWIYKESKKIKRSDYERQF
ncbi:MAG: SxtJ family membrane protein [Candidatus Mariimomonas ferrooxydans]